jgi:hypothetical protein
MNSSTIFIAAAAAAFSVGAHAAEPSISGKWRITRSVVAPWTDETGAGAPSLAVGSTVTFTRSLVAGPHPVGCRLARYEQTEVPTEGLFQGAGISANDAISLGLAGEKFEGVSVTCDGGVFEYHRASENSFVFALDNRIWTLDRSPGTKASAGAPEGVVQRFLEAHFAGDMGFWPSAIDSKRGYFTKALNEKMNAYFGRITDPDEAPEINGDPFTDSQDYPARFSVRSDDKTTPGVLAPVEFSQAFSRRTVGFSLKREGGRWLIDDLLFEDNISLATLLTH